MKIFLHVHSDFWIQWQLPEGWAATNAAVSSTQEQPAQAFSLTSVYLTPELVWEGKTKVKLWAKGKSISP